MDPQNKSMLTTIIGYAAVALAAWASGHGLIDAGQQTALVNILVTVVGTVGAAGVAWWKQRNQSPKALIQAVNSADNGVKVVPVNSPGMVVNEPIKGAK